MAATATHAFSSAARLGSSPQSHAAPPALFSVRINIAEVYPTKFG
jgi:hypothetical protein